jgi:ADP-dependent NAD(P)H-hydrate dehydratase / NAD(P)H-hydrate epimerase
MRPVLTAKQMREADRYTVDEVGLPGVVLMENAGAAVAEVIRDRYPGAKSLVIFCGKGNNGGDGLVVARRLLARNPLVVLACARADVTDDSRVHLEAFERGNGAVVEAAGVGDWRSLVPGLTRADLIVDALLGTGLRRPPEGVMADAISAIRTLAKDGVPVVAVDLPSGVPSDGGEISWPAVEATVTVTLVAPKHGLVLPPACDHVGELVVADIGVSASTVARATPTLFLLEAADAALAFPRRARAAHKGDFGHVLVIGGSPGKTGAAVLAASGAFAAGAGLVTIATTTASLPLVVAAARPEVMTEGLTAASVGPLDRSAAARALALAEARDAVVLGPGLGADPATQAFVREMIRECPVPIVIDADALNAISGDFGADFVRRDRPAVLTPHPGEMARLLGSTAAEVQQSRLETVRSAAAATGAVVVLKGQRTLIAHADGRVAVNPTGNPGMATAGTGDVLAGIVGALLARGTNAWTAATSAAYVHGAAGDEAARRLGEESLTASDVVAALPAALRALTSG